MAIVPTPLPRSGRWLATNPGAVAAPWRRGFEEFLLALDRATAGRALMPTLARLFGWTLLAWWIYVPLHELLHALGCAATGGSVGRLWIQPRYGGALLARVFPFVSPGGSYAGRLEGFDTHGSDLTYLSTVLLPYLLTVAGAFPLLRLAHRRASPRLLGMALVLLAAPLIGIPGDLYEAGSILVSAAMLPFWPAEIRPSPIALRHDDILALVREFGSRFPSHRGGWAAGVLLSALVGIALGSVLCSLSDRFARRLGLPEATGSSPVHPRPDTDRSS